MELENNNSSNQNSINNNNYFYRPNNSNTPIPLVDLVSNMEVQIDVDKKVDFDQFFETQNGFNYNQAISMTGATYLHYACQFQRRDIIQKLLNNNLVDINIRDNLGRSPLHYAAGTGFSDIIGYLLQSNADVNSVSTGGETPIMKAAYCGHAHVIKILIENQIGDLTIKNNLGQNVFDILKSHNMPLYIKYYILLVQQNIGQENPQNAENLEKFAPLFQYKPTEEEMALIIQNQQLFPNTNQ